MYLLFAAFSIIGFVFEIIGLIGVFREHFFGKKKNNGLVLIMIGLGLQFIVFAVSHLFD